MILAATLRSRVRMLAHTLLPERGRRAPRGAIAARVAVVLALVLAALAYLVMRQLLGLLVSAGATVHESGALVALLANLTLAGLLVFDLHEGVSALLADTDLDLLRRAPIRPHVQLGIKLFDALPRTSLLMVVMIVPAVIAFQATFGLHAWGWLLLPVQALSLWALPFGLGAALAVLMLRIVPARHAREALGLVSSLTLLVLWLANSFLLPRMAGDPAVLEDFRGALDRLAHGMPHTPGGWLARAIASAASGDLPAALADTARLLAAATAAIACVLLVAHTSLEHVQARIGAAPPRRGRAAPVRAAAGAGPRSIVAALLARDARLLGRNWTILGDLVTTVVLWTLLPVVLGPVFETSGGLLARAMLIALTVAVASEVAARAVPLERQALMWARLAPVAPARWLAGRLLGAAALSCSLMAAATATSAWALGLGAPELLRVVALVLPALAMALSLGLWAGVAYGDPQWTNPRAMLRPAGRIIATVLIVAQAVAWIALIARAPAAAGPGWWTIGAAGAVAAAVSAITFADGARRLGRLEVREP